MWNIITCNSSKTSQLFNFYIFIIKVKIAGYDSLESGAFTVEKVPENQRQKVAGDEVSQKRIRAPTHGSIVSIYII